MLYSNYSPSKHRYSPVTITFSVIDIFDSYVYLDNLGGQLAQILYACGKLLLADKNLVSQFRDLIENYATNQLSHITWFDSVRIMEGATKLGINVYVIAPRFVDNWLSMVIEHMTTSTSDNRVLVGYAIILNKYRRLSTLTDLLHIIPT